ncbi:hypothetical protein SNK04_014184 [Fusarium graminearum]
MRIIGGQVWQLCDLVDEFGITSITVETNGTRICASVLKAALKQRRLRWGQRGDFLSQ